MMRISQVLGLSSWALKHRGVAPLLALASMLAPAEMRRDMEREASEYAESWRGVQPEGWARELGEHPRDRRREVWMGRFCWRRAKRAVRRVVGGAK